MQRCTSPYVDGIDLAPVYLQYGMDTMEIAGDRRKMQRRPQVDVSRMEGGAGVLVEDPEDGLGATVTFMRGI